MESPVYRPVSNLAIAGLAVAILYAGIVGLVAVSVWRSGTPWLLTWTLLFAVIGAGLAGMAWLRIRRCEGMLAGLRLARWGLGLSAVFALVHGAIIAGKDLAVRQDAAAFSSDWFARLRQGDEYGAFLLTIPANERRGDTPDDLPRLQARYGMVRAGQKGPLPLFLEHELVQIIRQAGPQAKIESQGVRSWSFEAGGYLVEQAFRVTTPEGTFDVVLPMRGDARLAVGQDAGRQWHVVMGEQMIVRRILTPLGETLLAVRATGARYVEEWAKQVRQGKLTATDDLFQTNRLQATSDAAAEEIREKVEGLSRRPADLTQLQVPQGRALETCPWKIEQGELQIIVPIVVVMGGEYQCEGTATVAASDPPLVHYLQGSETDSAGPEARRWRVVRVDWLIGARLSEINAAR